MQRYLKTVSAAWLAAFGAVLGLAALTRSVLWLFPAPLVLFLVLLGPERRFAVRLVHCAVFLLAFAVVLAPWTIRNTRLQKTFITVDVMGGRNLMMGNYEHTPIDRPWAAIEIQGEQSWHHVLRQSLPEQFKGLTQGQIDKLAMKYALRYMADHRELTLRRAIAKFTHFWQLEREIIAGLMRGHWGHLSKPAILVIAAVILGSYVCVMVLGILGLTIANRSDWRMHLFVCMLIMFVCSLHTLVFGHSRYHLPLMPLIGIYAAAAVCGRRELFRSWCSPRVLCGAVACGVLILLWCRELVVEAVRS
jgi:4-amino-4-deoxy-L-arabinose transferase-like glycosyltransferase